MNRIVFLGTGCGGLPMLLQQRRTGGFFLELDRKKFIVDPGPGCLVNAKEAGLSLSEMDIVLLTHYHIDHCAEINALLDSLHGCVLIAERSCLAGKDKCIIDFVQDRPRKIHAVKPGAELKVGKFKIKTTKTDHYSPCVGFILRGSTAIGYTSDTSYFKGLENEFEACDILIINTLDPIGSPEREKWHMTVDGAIKMLKRMKQKPKLAVLRHFDSEFLDAGPEDQAKVVKEMTGVKTIAAKDFMEVNVNKLSTRQRKT